MPALLYSVCHVCRVSSVCRLSDNCAAVAEQVCIHCAVPRTPQSMCVCTALWLHPPAVFDIPITTPAYLGAMSM